ncbi:MAG: TM2 domain-containing protein [Sarcina sp.]
MYCKECGNEYQNSNANFCLECGVKKGNGNSFCQMCGSAKKSPNQDVCLTCGAKLKSGFGGFDNSNVNYNGGTSDKTKLITLLLWFFVGSLGIHQFYAGNNKRGILYLILIGVAVITCGIGSIATMVFLIIDLVQLLTDKMVDGEGRPITEWQ